MAIADVLFGSTVTAPGIAPANLVDGDSGTAWYAALGSDPMPFNIDFDMGSAKTFNKIEWTIFTTATRTPREVEIYVSANGIDWDYVDTVDKGAGASGYMIYFFLFAMQTKRYLRVRVLQNFGDGSFTQASMFKAFYEYNDLAKDVGTTVTASAGIAANTYDERGDTYVRPFATTLDMTYDFGSSKLVQAVRWICAQFDHYVPDSYKLQKSINDVDWIDILADNGVSIDKYEDYIRNFTAVNTRYFRINILSSHSSDLILAEILVFEEESSGGWAGKISGVTNPAKVAGVDSANIVEVKGVA